MVIPELSPGDSHHRVTKWRYSAFERTDLRQSLSFAGRDQLVITGVYAHMGCQVSATDAFMSDVQPFLVTDAVADFSAAEHRNAVLGRASTAEEQAYLAQPGSGF